MKNAYLNVSIQNLKEVILSVITCGTVSLLYKRSNFGTSILSGSLSLSDMKSREARRRIHERAMSLRFLGIILRVLRLEVSVYNVLTTYLCTYDLYGPVRDAFDAGSIHYEGKWEGVWPWKARVFWAL